MMVNYYHQFLSRDKDHANGEACKCAPQRYKHTYTEDNYTYNIHTVDKINYRKITKQNRHSYKINYKTTQPYSYKQAY